MRLEHSAHHSANHSRPARPGDARPSAREVARAAGGIAIFVSHRFSTVRMADHIVVLDGGRIVEEGDHQQLIAAGGLYSELYGIQARSYR